MFWKRKGKKKDGDEAEGSGASTATTTSTDTEDTAAADAPAEGDGAAADTSQTQQAKKAKKGAAAESGESEKPADSEAESGADDSDPAGEAEESAAAAADAAGGKSGKDRKHGKGGKGGADADESAEDDEPEEPGEEPAADVAAAGTGEAGEDGETAQGSEDAGDEEGDGEDDAEDTAPAARRKRSPTVEEDPEVPGTTEPDDEGVQRVRTVGVLKAEDQEIDVVSNTWIVDADDEGVIVIDPAHDAEAIMEAVGEREVYLVACTNGYNTHIAAAIEVAERDEAPIALHRRELRPWRRVHGAEHRPDLEIEGGGSLKAGDIEVDILPIPGTATGSVAYYISEKGLVFTGDSLRSGEVGTVAGGYLDYTQQLHSIGEMILTLPPDTRVLPDSGPETTVEEESANFDTWVTTG